MPPSRPRLKIVRRFGTALPGLTAKDHQKRDFPPGQHGTSPSRRKKSLYRQRLEEKQKVRFNYGVTERQLRNIFEEAGKLPGVTGHNLLALLERRLSNVVFRLGFARTIPAARQLVAHRHILVDGKTVDRPSYRVRRGQSIALRPASREIPAVVESTTKGPRLHVPSYLALDPSSPFEGKVIADPIRADASVVVDDAAIVEFYAQ